MYKIKSFFDALKREGYTDKQMVKAVMDGAVQLQDKNGNEIDVRKAQLEIKIKGKLVLMINGGVATLSDQLNNLSAAISSPSLL